MITTWLKYTLLSTVAFLAPVKAMMVLVFALVFIDLVTGVWAAKKRGERITSAKLRRTLTKLFIFEIALLFGFLLQSLLGNIIPIANLVAGIIGLAEAKSFFENASQISGTDFSDILLKLGSKNDDGTPRKEK